MAKKKNEAVDLDPWERQPDETARAFEAFAVYRDLGPNRSIRKTGQALGKNLTTIGEWSVKYDWVNRCAAWDIEQERINRQEMLDDIAKTRKKQRQNAQKMQESGMAFLKRLDELEGVPALKDIVQLLKLGMEQERITMGDVGEVIEERNGGEAISPVQIYLPDNGRGKKDDFDDLDV